VVHAAGLHMTFALAVAAALLAAPLEGSAPRSVLGTSDNGHASQQQQQQQQPFVRLQEQLGETAALHRIIAPAETQLLLAGNSTPLCPSKELVDGILGAAVTTGLAAVTGHADFTKFNTVLLSLLIVFGTGLLVFGACFQTASIFVALGIVLFLVTAIVGTPLLLQNPHIDHCWVPLGFALGLTLGILLALGLVFYFCSLLTKLRDFLVGFTLGLLGMLITFIAIQQATHWEWTTHYEQNKPALIGYVCGTVVVGIIVGVISIWFLPVLGILLRCAVGGISLAVATNGLVGQHGGALPAYAFYLIFIGTAVLGAIWQFMHLERSKREAEPQGTHARPSPSAAATRDPVVSLIGQ